MCVLGGPGLSAAMRTGNVSTHDLVVATLRTGLLFAVTLSISEWLGRQAESYIQTFW